ncbi:MAG: hypothetical protein R3C13_12595 [Hyphomonas sp.]|uniref:hypothetical protein n=1 Tax=Hyphomonas sp. TaxID=87 RepID=UPI003529668B
MNLRLPIVIGMYAFIVVFLPRNPAVDRMFDKVRTVDPDIAISISVAAFLAAAVGLWMMWRQPNGILRKRPTRMLVVLNYGLIGVVFAGAFDMMERLAGSATDLISLMLVPFAFMIAEGVYLALEWRLGRRFDRE